MTTNNGEWFGREALAQIPKLLTLLDRNVHSPTYGCFDRNFWQYKIIDFPSGMAQEFCWPLALAYQANLSNNFFYQQAALRQWVEAAILYAARSAHADGSCDDYFPYEKAAGAAAFSLLACVESYRLLNLENDEALHFFRKRANWLAEHEESGRLTNHQALIALGLQATGELLKTNVWKNAQQKRLEKILSWQHEEGWFPEYEGCDPGYHTLTIFCLARLYEKNSAPALKEALEKAVKLAALFVHPDGSFGGEYTSRNTYNFFPHGFELVGKWMPEALAINDAFLKGAERGMAPCYADDHIIGHHAWNYFLAWQDFVKERPQMSDRKQGRTWLAGAKILIERRKDAELYLALNKGGVFKFFRGEKLIVSDTQPSFLVREGKKIKNAVAHLVGSYQTRIETNRVVIEGSLGWAKQKLMTPFRLIVLRVIMLTGGRFFPDLIRRILQKILITNPQPAPFAFERILEWQDDKLSVTDQIRAKTWSNVIHAGIGGDQTSIYVVMSRTFQKNQLQPWEDLTAKVKNLKSEESLLIERMF
ncbi:MAG: hypothetical protein K1X66_09010 [Verrucomicrobiae bacterium]|nr:hypothetical protein [Verrucomicrobiae bacterium]